MSIPIIESTKTILIVDDEEAIRKYLKLILEKNGYRVIIAKDGEEGVSRFNEHRDISLVLVDVCMPRKNGKEFFDDVSKIRVGTKVIFMSGYSGSLTEWIVTERLEFISKPFKLLDILRKIREVLDKH